MLCFIVPVEITFRAARNSGNAIGVCLLSNHQPLSLLPIVLPYNAHISQDFPIRELLWSARFLTWRLGDGFYCRHNAVC